MDGIRDLLERGEQLDEPDRALLVKLIWLHGQVDEELQRDVRRRVRSLLAEADMDWPSFMDEVQQLVAALERELTPGAEPREWTEE